MLLTPGTRLGPYEILSAIGAGGMGEVYRAHDTRLNRDVAVKILADAFASDPDRMARFTREAQTLAALNHPNIAHIHGLEESNGIRALVMELVEGEDLSQRIVRGAIPLAEALPLAKQIAEALEAAHEQGIIHRDLKPANIKIRNDNMVKVLDFGLAKALDPVGSAPNLSNSPTIATPAVTQAGVILGTAAYMSPEQANGRAVDRSSDLWAFGCVLFEMLTAMRAFPGDTTTEVLAGVLKADPDWRKLPAGTPEAVRRLLARCLRKDRAERLRDARDARLDIIDAQQGSQLGDRVTAASGQRGRGERIAWASALALVTLIALAMAVMRLWTRPQVSAAPEVRLEIVTPPTLDPALAVSPDGRKVIFVAKSEGPSQLWLRSLDSQAARPIAGTDGASLVFWSPDSRSVGFFADEKLKQVDLNGGSIRTLGAASAAGLGGAWSPDGTLIFSTNPGRPIVRLSPGGGAFVPVTRFQAPQQASQSYPRFLPDGRHFLFYVSGSAEARGVYLGQLDNLDARRLFDADGHAEYAATGHVLFPRDGKLMAQRFDPVRVELMGEQFPIAEYGKNSISLSASAAGPIVYRTMSPDNGQRQLVWLDRSGRETGKVLYPDTSSQGPAMSRDGRHIAVFRYAGGNMDVWSYDVVHHTWDRITFDSADDIFPLWSPDSSRIVFSSNRTDGLMRLYSRTLASPPGSEELLLKATEGITFPMDWSSDGRFVLYNRRDAKQGWDIWALPMQGDRTPIPAVRTDFNERSPAFSPDGAWIAYESDRSGREEVYVQPFPGPGSETVVSTNGGGQARWNSNGRELFYIASDDRLMAVPMRFASGGKMVDAGTPVALFTTNVGSAASNTNRQQYMVTPDGQTFVMNSVPEKATASPISVILNWKPAP